MRVLRRAFVQLWLFSILISIVFITILYQRSESSRDCENYCPYSSRLINDRIMFDSSHIIEYYPAFICPQNFRNLADWIYGGLQEEVETITQKAQLIAPCLPDGSIIYVGNWAIDSFFRSTYPHLIHNFVLITGEGDLPSPTYLDYLDRSDSKIIHWFGQNGQYDVSQRKKFTRIPIGIDCYQMARAIEDVYSKQPYHKLSPVYGDKDEPDYYIQLLDVTQRELDSDLVLINFDKTTDRTGLRSTVWKDLCTPENPNDYSFVTCFNKTKGVQIDVMSAIYERNRIYPFWLSPRGSSLDCHRTWEALYLDIIPIVWNSSLNILYQDLPVLIINDHKELNETFLRHQFQQISEKKQSTKKSYRYDKLRHAYWRRLILTKSRHRNLYQRPSQCWRASRLVASHSH